ncbi:MULTISPECIES: hypothetical protein [unclassified Streptomyces]|uniref:hypothetical protein n=1 Tax=unclassified Streptomyces TaxID=2593676 RepID=UPI003D8B0FB8
MDWSVVAVGCVLVLVSLGSRWWERTKISEGETPDQALRFFWAWFPLLMGLGMIGTRVPHLWHAPYAVVEIVDAVSFVLAATVLVFAVRSARRVFRARGAM